MTALAKVQAAIGPISKSKEVKVEGERAQWASKFAPLPKLDEVARPHLNEAGIAVVQTTAPGTGGSVHVTRFALGGEWFEVVFPLKPSRDGAQGLGAAITFARRWAYCAALNMIPDDGEEQQGYRQEERATRAPRRAAAPGGLAGMLDVIRESQGLNAFEDAARKARAAHPAGEGAIAVERAITARLVVAIESADADKLALCNEVHQRLQARGTEVRSALAAAEKRLGLSR